MKKRRVVWSKWVDPLNRNIDEVEYPGHHLPTEPGEECLVEYLSPYGDGDVGVEGELPDPDKFHVPKTTKIVQTSLGFLTLTEHSYASNCFDFWTCHCNFPITTKVAIAMEKAPGVEVFNVVTRYRARMGFNRTLLEAKAFTLDEIRSGVETAVLATCNKNKVLEDAQNLLLFSVDVRALAKETKRKLSDSKHWAMYILPNGKVETFSEPEKTTNMQTKIDLFNRTQEFVGGSVFTSAE